MVRYVIPAALLALVVAGCGSGESRPPSSTKQSTRASSTSVEPPAAPEQSWTMPDLRGQNLQSAQDAIQALTDGKVFFSSSTDLTGQGRRQVLDRNWQVCTSTPAPGETFAKGTAIDFGVVRVDVESCP